MGERTMKSIMFRCVIDGCLVYVDISKLYGGVSFQIMMNKMFITCISYLNDEWVLQRYNQTWLTTDELTIFMDHFDAEVVFEEEI